MNQEEEYTGSVYGGIEDETIEPIAIGDPEYAEMLAGAPVAKVMTQKAGKKGAMSTAKMRSIGRTLATPGAAIAAATLQSLYAENGIIIQNASTAAIPGDLIKYNLDLHRTETPFTSVLSNAVGAGVAVDTDNVLNNSDLPAGAAKYTAPVIFVTIAASALNARAGARYQISLVGMSRSGAALDATKWIVERKDASKPLKLVIIPFIRVKDTILPQVAAFGAVTGANDALTVRISGADATESVQIIAPGQDSQELRAFLKTWNINS